MSHQIISDDEGNKYLLRDEPIHPWRWRGLAVWVIIFTGVTFWVLVQNRQAVNDLRNNRAKVAALLHTNCALQKFLLSARDARAHAAVHDKDPAARHVDQRAAKQYGKLARTFDGACD